MVHLIDKDALVKGIEKLKAEAFQKKSQCKRSGLEKIMHQIGVYNKILSFLNTLEVKEVHLDCNITGIKSKHAEGQLKECIGRITEESLAKARKQLKKESVSEELDVIAREYAGIPFDAPKDSTYRVHDKKAKYDAVLFGANWKEQQLEKNRLAACDRQTEEEAEREQDFVMGIIENEHRQPTFDDAIKYGMRLQKEQMMVKAFDGDITFDCYGDDGKTYGCIAHDSFCLEDFGLKDRDKVKVIVIKEE